MTNHLAKIISKLKLNDEETINFCYILKTFEINKERKIINQFSSDELQVAFLLAILRRLKVPISFNEVCELVKVSKIRRRTIRRIFEKNKIAFKVKYREKERRKIGRPKKGIQVSKVGRPELEYELLPWDFLLDKKKIIKFGQFFKELGYEKEIKTIEKSLMSQLKTDVLLPLKVSINLSNHKFKENIIRMLDNCIEGIDKEINTQ